MPHSTFQSTKSTKVSWKWLPCTWPCYSGQLAYPRDPKHAAPSSPAPAFRSRTATGTRVCTHRQRWWAGGLWTARWSCAQYPACFPPCPEPVWQDSRRVVLWWTWKVNMKGVIDSHGPNTWTLEVAARFCTWHAVVALVIKKRQKRTMRTRKPVAQKTLVNTLVNTQG